MPITLARVLFASVFLGVGPFHFIQPQAFTRIVPPFLPAPRLLVAISGACEILGGLGMLWEPTRPWAAWGLIALLIAVFPANIYMAMRGMRFGRAPVWLTWARLGLQPLLVWWGYHYTMH